MVTSVEVSSIVGVSLLETDKEEVQERGKE